MQFRELQLVPEVNTKSDFEQASIGFEEHQPHEAESWQFEPAGRCHQSDLLDFARRQAIQLLMEELEGKRIPLS